MVLPSQRKKIADQEKKQKQEFRVKKVMDKCDIKKTAAAECFKLG